MEIVPEVKAWLESKNRDYKVGLALLSRVPGMLMYSKRIAHRVDTKLGQDDIDYELGKFYKVQVDEQKYLASKKKRQARTFSKKIAQKQSKQPKEKTKILYKPPKGKLGDEEFKKAPKEIKEVEKQWRKLYKRRGYLKAVMPYMETADERYEAAKLVVEISRQIMHHHATIDFWREHKIVPDRKKNQFELPETLNNTNIAIWLCRSRISKERAKLRINADDQVAKGKLKNELIFKLRLKEHKIKLEDEQLAKTTE